MMATLWPETLYRGRLLFTHLCRAQYGAAQGAWLVCRKLGRRLCGSKTACGKTALVGGILTASVQLAAGVQPLAGRIPIAVSAKAAAPQYVAMLPPLPSTLAELAGNARGAWK